ncbi:heterokaryon incompatibility protein-domain-containing protein [Podospora aff. communis PSN243]|uniref:Heterokaryon incompatibility protein-domain-containing protein n=1 Tax=Podospora aff. communis PSN243 TaxID=3040156 RepID=A0AAV9GLQ5_9PEZI|nr:heterokaryon incompatibility protein-domain-containing protein [Podospora aff. communis PSN243]
MRLINTKTLQLKEFWGNDIPRYAILSHTWEEEEVTFQQLTQLSREEVAKFKGFKKIERTCQLADRSGIKWAWVDTCCIDKSSSAELTEAINSMFRWYQESAVCFAYLSDLKNNRRKEKEWKVKDREQGAPKGGQWEEKGASEKSWEGEGKKWEANQESEDWAKESKEQNKEKDAESRAGGSDASSSTSDGLTWRQRVDKFASCRWFTRGWTLQELIAPRRLGFYNQDWVFEGEKDKLSSELAEITRISKRVLTNAALLSTIPVAQRMSWAANRQTTRAEDMAYCLLGLFGVQIPMLYGEGTKAFIRLQEEIIKESNDLSLFAWQAKVTSQKHLGILALSPKDFAECAKIELWDDAMYNDEVAVTSKGLRITPVSRGVLRLGKDETYILSLQCYQRGSGKELGIFLRKHGCDVFTRVLPEALADVQDTDAEVTGAKGRVFYISKMVSPVLSVVLGSSHRNGIDFSHAKRALKKIRYQLDHEVGIHPIGHWDTQRSLFLTQGTREFYCRVRFVHDEDSNRRPLVLQCELRENELLATFVVGASSGKVAKGGVLQKQDSRGRLVDWLEVKVIQKAVKGQPVYFVDVDVLPVF